MRHQGREKACHSMTGRAATHELGEEDLAALSQKREDAWNALSRPEQQHLTEQLRAMVPHATGGTAKGRS